MATSNYSLPTPPDSTMVADFPKELRDSNVIVDGVLKTQGDQVTAAQTAAESAEQAAIDAAGLVGTPPDTAIEAALGATNSKSRHKMSLAIDLAANPTLGMLQAMLTRCNTYPTSWVALGSSSTAAPLDDPTDRWVDRLNVMMQAQYASGPGATTPTGGMTGTIQSIPGIHGYNLGISGATTRTYLPAAQLSRIQAIQPNLITHAIGSNDARYGYTAAEVKQNIRNAINQIDAVVTAPHVHIIIHMHERDDADISAKWAEFREELRALSIDTPALIGFIDISRHFASIGIPGPDPFAYRKTDRVHLEPFGLHMVARLLGQAMGVSTEKRKKRLLAMDSFTRADGELGQTDTGQRWRNADAFQIVTYKAKSVSSGGGTPLIFVDTPDMDVTADYYIPAGDNLIGGIAFRALNGTNRYRLMIVGGTTNRVSMYADVAGNSINRWNVNYDFSAGGTFTIRAVVKDREMQAYINGELVYTYRLNPADEAALGNATGAGLTLAAASPGRTWDEFRVYESA